MTGKAIPSRAVIGRIGRSSAADERRAADPARFAIGVAGVDDRPPGCRSTEGLNVNRRRWPRQPRTTNQISVATHNATSIATP
jgi:hypothetical protein